jgi:hypothetical protein
MPTDRGVESRLFARLPVPARPRVRAASGDEAPHTLQTSCNENDVRTQVKPTGLTSLDVSETPVRLDETGTISPNEI